MRFQRGFSLIELLIVVVVIGVIAAIAIPNFLASKRAANEGTAISSLRTLHGAQMTYQSTHGAGSFSSTFANLQAAGLIDPLLGTGTKGGYTYEVTANAPTATAYATFSFSAVPTATSGYAQTGSRNFCVRTEGVIRYVNDPSQLGTQISFAQCAEGVANVFPVQP